MNFLSKSNLKFFEIQSEYQIITMLRCLPPTARENKLPQKQPKPPRSTGLSWTQNRLPNSIKFKAHFRTYIFSTCKNDNDTPVPDNRTRPLTESNEPNREFVALVASIFLLFVFFPATHLAEKSEFLCHTKLLHCWLGYRWSGWHRTSPPRPPPPTPPFYLSSQHPLSHRLPPHNRFHFQIHKPIHFAQLLLPNTWIN